MQPTPLVPPHELAARMERGEPLVVIDTRAPASYHDGHLPGAVNMHEVFTFLATSTPDGLSALRETFAALLGAAGVSGDEQVVFYEEAMNTGYGQTCRGWFLLTYLGHRQARILHGGLQAWAAEGRPLVTDVPRVTPRTFQPRIDDSLMVTTADVHRALGDPGIVMLDVRDHDEWTGESSSPYGKDFAPRKGRIPGAVWIEWYHMMQEGGPTPWFRPPAQIRDLCRAVGIESTSTVYLYCFKGARASNTMVALKEAGISDVHMYLGSWNEWSRDPALPIEEGPPDPRRMARPEPYRQPA